MIIVILFPIVSLFKCDIMQPCFMNFTIIVAKRNIISATIYNPTFNTIGFYYIIDVPNLPRKICVTKRFYIRHFTHVFLFTNTHVLTKVTKQFFAVFESSRKSHLKLIKITSSCCCSHLRSRHSFYTFGIRITFSSRYNIYVVKLIVTMTFAFNTIVVVQQSTKITHTIRSNHHYQISKSLVI